MVEKLNDIIKDRYGKGFSVRQIASVGGEPTTDSSIRGDDLYVPIFVKDVFLGYGLIHEARDLSQDQQAHVSRLVKMVLEPELYSKHLERTIHNMEIERSINGDQEGTATKSIFILGHNAARVQKIGVEIHEISQNWNYLPLKDIETSLKSSDDLVELSNTTLVVDLEKGLEAGTQTLIADYLESDKRGALLLFVASKPLYQLLEAKLIDQRLYEILKISEFSVDRLPIEKSALIEVLQMMYFQS